MRKQKKYHLIYKTTNLLNGKYYIGMHSTNNLDDGYMGSGRRLRYSINKHGRDNHKVEVLEFVETREELIARETEIVNLNEIAKVHCLNLRVGGEGGFSSEEHRLKFEKAREWGRIIGGENTKLKLKGKELSDCHIMAITEGLKRVNYNHNTFEGKVHSNESKLKISESMKGKGKGETNSQHGSCWITNEIVNNKIKRGDLLPEGFRLGRILK